MKLIDRLRSYKVLEHDNDAPPELLREAAARISELEILMREAIECGAFDDAPLLLKDVRKALKATDSKEPGQS